LYFGLYAHWAEFTFATLAGPLPEGRGSV
jgi:hypothetical protein